MWVPNIWILSVDPLALNLHYKWREKGQRLKRRRLQLPFSSIVNIATLLLVFVASAPKQLLDSSMASFTVPCPKVLPMLAASTDSPHQRCHVASFPRSDSRSALPLITAHYQHGSSRAKPDTFKVSAKAQLTEIDAEKISNDTPALETSQTVKSEDLCEVPDASSVSTFMAQVMDLVKLVDSKDIVELQLKQMDSEILIKKKEALPQPSITAAPVLFAPPPAYQAVQPPQLPPAGAPSPVPSAPASAATPAPSLKLKSSHPSFKCPMAGTFYRSPAPGAPPFVKVGDKVQKGQVICIIEAMKLMNEIEADHSGTVVEILAEDGKPVSVDTPLFIIKP